MSHVVSSSSRYNNDVFFQQNNLKYTQRSSISSLSDRESTIAFQFAKAAQTLVMNGLVIGIGSFLLSKVLRHITPAVNFSNIFFPLMGCVALQQLAMMSYQCAHLSHANPTYRRSDDSSKRLSVRKFIYFCEVLMTKIDQNISSLFNIRSYRESQARCLALDNLTPLELIRNLPFDLVKDLFTQMLLQAKNRLKLDSRENVFRRKLMRFSELSLRLGVSHCLCESAGITPFIPKIVVVSTLIATLAWRVLFDIYIYLKSRAQIRYTKVNLQLF